MLFRSVSATHRGLRQLVKQGDFREDLMYRIRVIPLFLPPLIDRGNHLPMLIWHFIEQFNQGNHREITEIETAAWQAMLEYPWPGNIRELANVIEYAYAVGLGSVLTFDDLNPDLQQQDSDIPPIVAEHKTNEADLPALFRKHQGNRALMAKDSGLSRTTLWRKLKALGLT